MINRSQIAFPFSHCVILIFSHCGVFLLTSIVFYWSSLPVRTGTGGCHSLVRFVILLSLGLIICSNIISQTVLTIQLSASPCLCVYYFYVEIQRCGLAGSQRNYFKPILSELNRLAANPLQDCLSEVDNHIQIAP